jgi:hypothetical protein
MKFLLYSFFSFCFTVLAYGASDNILIDGNGHPKNIYVHRGASMNVVNGLLNVSVPHGSACNGTVHLEPEWKYLRLDMEMRTENMVQGDQPWQCGQMAMRFYNADKKPVGGWPKMFQMSGTNNWTKCSRIYKIPEHAVRLSFDPANFGKKGIAEYRNILLRAFKNREDAEGEFTGAPIPPVEKLWNMSDAENIRNAKRERITLNSIWQFKPVDSAAAHTAPAPADYNLYFKVPGIWPGFNSWMQPRSTQAIYKASGRPAHIDGKKLNNAWYRRTIDIPENWQNRKIELEFTYIQTCGQLFIDGQKAGEVFFPGGSIDITGKVTPGSRHDMAILVSAKVDETASIAFNAPDRISKTPKTVICRGITGDVYLKAEPQGMRIDAVQLITSLTKKNIVCNVEFKDIIPGEYDLDVYIFDKDQKIKSFGSKSIKINGNDNVSIESPWDDPRLWDVDTPENLYSAVVELKKPTGETIDILYPEEFGFREFELKGRHFYLNGKRINLRSAASQLPIAGAAWNTPAQYQKNARLIKSFGQNHLIALNYNFSAGQVGYQDAFYVENSRNGILTTLTLPHPSNFNWKLDDPQQKKRYLQLAGYIIKRYRNVPGMILYASTHNATGYAGDQNPERIDGIYSPDKFMKKTAWYLYNRRQQALLAGELVKTLDPTRAVYHHESGNLGPMYTINCYLNWAPAQERSDWLEHWESKGVKPLFMMEWGMPHVCSWSSFRGPAFIWGNSAVQCMWIDEFNAEYLGEEAYRNNKNKEGMINLQEKINSGNKKVHFSKFNWFSRWTDVQKVWSIMIRDNFPAMRARGLSGLLPWDQDAFWSTWSPVISKNLLPERFENLKKTGISPDYSAGLVDGYDRALTTVGKNASQTFQPQIGWIAGKPGDFTEKNTYFLPGEKVKKSLVILNDTRHSAVTNYRWSIPELEIETHGSVKTAPGERSDIPVEFEIPEHLTETTLTINAQFDYAGKSKETDSLYLKIGRRPQAAINSPVYVYDPENSAVDLLKQLNVTFKRAEKMDAIPDDAVLVIGRNALPSCKISAKKRLILEQSLSTLQQLGLRGNEHGLRNIIPLHDSLFGKPLSNWRGGSTLVKPYLDLPEYENHMPSADWCGFNNKRVWRAGNRGTVAGTIPEKPSIGNWLPLCHGGFDLQYAPLLEFKENDKIIIFCQLDVSARTEYSPEALELFSTILKRIDSLPLPVSRQTFCLGGKDSDTEKLLKALKIKYSIIEEIDSCPDNALLIIGSGSKLKDISDKLAAGLNILAIGLDAKEIEQLLPGQIKTETRENVFSDYVSALTFTSPVFAGISNAELHWRKPLNGTFFPSDSPGGQALNVVENDHGHTVFCQITPLLFDKDEFQYRTTRRRCHFLISRLAHNLGAESNSGLLSQITAKNDESMINKGMVTLSGEWLGKADPEKQGRKEKWFSYDFKPDDQWRKIKVPGMFDQQFEDLTGYDGWFWYHKTFDADNIPTNTELTLFFGTIDDESWIWLNGELIGELTSQTNPKDYWAAERKYIIPSSKLKPRNNVITVLCNDLRMGGGILGTPAIKFSPPYRLYADTPESGDDPYRYYRW